MSDDEFLPRNPLGVVPGAQPMLVSMSSLPDSNTQKAGTLLDDKILYSHTCLLDHHNIIQQEWVHLQIQDPPSVESVIEPF